ncbi:PREDICTED: putative F-box/LRR-repeat protein 23 [Camelina sativa]|uniref:F-box/LRR-repeat protein 23 n=1 Tax=Camelina sativa TaxID=90675 RepID=A0ABM0VIZ0_CAMSA|nr:PREDICTED: putative F-box/LRR-repeat protein 23 [Camelina sativa]
MNTEDLSVDDLLTFIANRSIKLERLGRMMCHAVDLSQGGLVEINIELFGTDSLLTYIVDRSSNLRRLGLAKCDQITGMGLFSAVMKLPLLEELELSYCKIRGQNLEAIGYACPHLKTLKLNCQGYRLLPHLESNYGSVNIAKTMLDTDYQIIDIVKRMHELRHLQLFGNRLTDIGFNAILDGCPHLEHLDLRQCFNINLVGDLEKRCLEKVKVLRRPNDSTADYPYDTSVLDLPF